MTNITFKLHQDPPPRKDCTAGNALVVRQGFTHSHTQTHAHTHTSLDDFVLKMHGEKFTKHCLSNHRAYVDMRCDAM